MSAYVTRTDGGIDVKEYRELFQDGKTGDDVLQCIGECGKEFTRAEVLQRMGNDETCPECGGTLARPDADADEGD